MVLVFGALLGFISVAFGAFAEHGLRGSITAEHFQFLMTAVRYNQIHAIIISAIGLALLNGGKLSRIPTLKWSAWFFIVGVILFSFSIYLSILFNLPALINMTPIGGMTIMAAWLLLLCSGLLAKKKW